jgi:hypothetical protein
LTERRELFSRFSLLWRAVSIFMRWPQYTKNAYLHAELFRKWERFLKTTASLSNLILPCFYYLTNLVSGS